MWEILFIDGKKKTSALMNETLKLFSNTLNALALGITALAIVKPAVDSLEVQFGWLGAAVFLHLIAHMALWMQMKE